MRMDVEFNGCHSDEKRSTSWFSKQLVDQELKNVYIIRTIVWNTALSDEF